MPSLPISSRITAADRARELPPDASVADLLEAHVAVGQEVEVEGRRAFLAERPVPGAQRDALVATPVNLGSSELVSIDELVSRVEKIAGVKLEREYDLGAPKGVAGRNSDNTFIRQVLGWEPGTTLDAGLAATYPWIRTQYRARHRSRSAVRGAVV